MSITQLNKHVKMQDATSAIMRQAPESGYPLSFYINGSQGAHSLTIGNGGVYFWDATAEQWGFNPQALLSYRGSNPSGFNYDSPSAKSGYYWINKNIVVGTFPPSSPNLWGVLVIMPLANLSFALQFFITTNYIAHRMYLNGAWGNWTSP